MNSIKSRWTRRLALALLAIGGALGALAVACGGGDPEVVTEIQTVVVEKQVTQVEKVIETVVVDREVTRTEKVIETVVVEKIVEGQTVKVVETVVVERPVTRTEKVVQTVVVVATAMPAMEVPAEQKGTLRVAVASITPPVFRPSLLKWPVNLDKVAWGVADPLTYHPHTAPVLGDTVPEALAVSWEAASDGTSVTFQLRQGVQFHDGWGELTADDVVYTLDDALFAEGTIAKIAESRIWMDKWVKEDDYTVTMTTVDGEFIPPQWDRSLSNNSSLGGIWSKKVFDDLGPDGAAETPIGTGPFTVNKWVANEEVILDAQESHYRATPSVEQVVIREIPEEATRLAAFRSGEVDITPVSLRFLGSILGETGAHAVETNSSARVTVWYAGNHWIKTDLLTGDPVEPRPAFQPTDEYPWIGDPDDPARMERSAKVRHAMSMAIDRDAINLAILNGLGQVGPNTWYNFSPDDAHWKEEWRDEFKFDPDGAKALLDESGFGPFSIDFFVTPDLPTIVNPQTGEAIAQMWQDNLGITVNIDSTAYSAKRPSLVDRSFIGAYIWTYGSPSPDTPQTYAQRPSVGGWNPGVEIGCVDDTWFSIRAELDLQKRLDANASAQDCLHKYRWAALVVKVPIFAVVAKHVDWQPTTLPGVEAGDFERAVIR
jgi:ABC-type transport system substrate-binding protein